MLQFISDSYYYAAILLSAVLGPFILSFSKQTATLTYLRYAFFAIIVVSLPFILGDMLYTYLEVWGFNSIYVLGIYIYILPIEEVLFFILIPFCCVFIFECVLQWCATKYNIRILLGIASCICLATAFIFYKQYYTAATTGFSAIVLGYMFFRYKARYANIAIAFLFSCIPFLLVNGALTGGFSPEPVVWYNSAHICNIRIGSIPIEDISYSWNMVSLVLLIYSALRNRETQGIL